MPQTLRMLGICLAGALLVLPGSNKSFLDSISDSRHTYVLNSAVKELDFHDVKTKRPITSLHIDFILLTGIKNATVKGSASACGVGGGHSGLYYFKKENGKWIENGHEFESL